MSTTTSPRPRSAHVRVALMAFFASCCSTPTAAAGGPFGIDHRIGYDDSGIWSRHNQLALQDAVVLSVVGGALWEGRDSRLGATLWKSVDAMAIGAVAAGGMKLAFSRARPAQTDDPNEWFRGRGHNSFPSGEVVTVAAAVTPLVMEYAQDHPAVWALTILPVYDAVARVKVRAHWQSDVIASLALGGAIGAYARSRSESIFVGVLPGGITVGWKKSF
jgi:undecaprenyl-diphosphatase